MANIKKLAKGLTSAIKGTQDVLPAAERQANLAKMLEQSVVKDRLYHGTKSPIKSFDLSKRGSSDVSSVGGGIYLTPDPNVASFYSKIVPGESGSNVMPVHAQVKNPFEYDLAMPFKSQKDSNEFSRRLQEAGYDSIIKRGKDGEIVELVVFDPNKIKSATGNRGTYDVTKPDLNEAKGGRVKMAAGGVSKAAKAITSLLKGTQDVLPAAEREANLAKFLEQSKTPMRLYHGTTATEAGKGTEAISRLKPSKEGSLGSGVYLTPKPEFAGQYASTAGGNVLPVHAQLRNPLIIEGKHGDPMIEALMKLGMDESKAAKLVERAYENKGYIGKEVENRARAAGYDGLMQYRNGELGEVVSYNPNAVKSAIGNKGTYDVYNQDLNKAGGGSINMAAGGGLKAMKALIKAAEEPKARGFSDKVLQSTTNKMAEDLMAANPKLTAEEAAKKARVQAEKKLAWETEQKPALVKEYGPLARASYAKSNPEKMQNTPEMVRQRMARANAFLDQPTEAWTPPRPELQAFDRSSIKDALEGFPGVSQTAFPRDIPARASTSHVEELYTDPANRELIKKQISRGLPLGGESFYASLYPIKQAVLEAGMPAEKFDKWIHSLAPASARNSIMNETAVGQFLRDMNARGIPLTEENVAKEMAAYKQKFGIGLPLMPIHRQGVANVLEGGQDLREMSKANIPTNYKIPTYGTQKAGDFAKSAVLDVHEAAGQTQGSRFHPYFREQGGFGNTEYNAGEQGLLGIAQEMGIPGGMAQAGRWFGGGELTGLRSPRGDALDLLEKQVAYTLKQQGKQPNPAMIRQEILRQIETGEGNLLPWFKKEAMPDVRETGLQRKDGGEVSSESFADRLKSSLEQHMADGGEVNSFASRLQSALSQHMAEGGEVDNTTPDMTDGGNVNYAEGFAEGGSAENAPSATRQMFNNAIAMGKEALEAEYKLLKDPAARADILKRIGLTIAGSGPDLMNLLASGVDLAQEQIPFLRKKVPESIMDEVMPMAYKRPSSYAPKFPLSSNEVPGGAEHQIRNAQEAGLLGEAKAPITETIASLAGPFAVGAAARTAAKTAKAAPTVAKKLVNEMLTPMSPRAAQRGSISLGNVPQEGASTTGAAYATKQEGPFFRVSPVASGASPAAGRGIREADELQGQTSLGGGAGQAGSQVPTRLSDEEVARIISDPAANEPLNIAKKYTQETQGAEFVLPEIPESSLVKQSAIGRAHQLAVEGTPQYKSAVFDAYAREMPEVLEQSGAKNYDDLMEKAYRQLAKETDAQFQSLPYNFSYHRAGEGNYLSSKEMAADVHGNKHLYVFQGGDPHDFLNRIDPVTGLNENEKFRAVHDLLGHAIYGNQFGPKGEEVAWAIHSQMYSPLARLAMTAETRGQNSMVNYSPLNANLKAEIAKYDSMADEARRRGDKGLLNEINAAKRQAYSGFQFAPQKAVLLPPEFLSSKYSGGMPSYLESANLPVKGTETQSALTHFSNRPDLQFVDPRKYGTGIKGAEADRLKNLPGGVRDRAYFYMGEPGSVTPEPGLGVNRYLGESSSLYDITQDPLNFRVLSREANRVPYTAKYNQGITNPLQEANDMERLVKEYGYQGMANPKSSKPMAIMFKETPVIKKSRGGLAQAKG